MIVSFFILFSFAKLRGCIDPMRKKVRSTLFVLCFSYGRRLGVFDPFGFGPLAYRGLAVTAPRATHVIAFFGTRFARRGKVLASARLLGGLRE
jgi:hypothetical protein